MVQLRVKPRLEQISWSLYWKEAMEINTQCLDEVELEVEGEGAQAVLDKCAQTLGWQPTSQLQRLENFKEPWERLLFRGRDLGSDQSLQACGIKDGDTLVVVRRVLSADGWAVAMQDDFLSDEEL